MIEHIWLAMVSVLPYLSLIVHFAQSLFRHKHEHAIVELEKLAIRIGLATVSRYLPKGSPDPHRRQSWRTFLRNHRDAIGAMAFKASSTCPRAVSLAQGM